jgi:hypothetical protein
MKTPPDLASEGVDSRCERGIMEKGTQPCNSQDDSAPTTSAAQLKSDREVQ